jgi:hypothetical protein
VYFFVTHAPKEHGGSVIEAHGESGRISWTRDKGSVIESAEGSREYGAFSGAERYVLILETVRKAIAGEDVFYPDLELSSMQTLAINGAHEASEIHTIAPEHIERIHSGGSTVTIVDGLDDAIARGFAEEKLFSELANVPWAREKGEFDLSGYKEFTGGKS